MLRRLCQNRAQHRAHSPAHLSARGGKRMAEPSIKKTGQNKRVSKCSSPSFNSFRPASVASSRSMRGNRARDTQPELLLRRALRPFRIRFRICDPTLPGRPDLVSASARLAVFCDGDFWHGRYWGRLREQLAQRANPAYWIPKIAANRARDRLCQRALRRAGWTVLRVWESDIRRNPDAVAREVARVVGNSVEHLPARAPRRGPPSAGRRLRRQSELG